MSINDLNTTRFAVEESFHWKCRPSVFHTYDDGMNRKSFHDLAEVFVAANNLRGFRGRQPARRAMINEPDYLPCGPSLFRKDMTQLGRELATAKDDRTPFEAVQIEFLVGPSIQAESKRHRGLFHLTFPSRNDRQDGHRNGNRLLHTDFFFPDLIFVPLMHIVRQPFGLQLIQNDAHVVRRNAQCS